MYQYSGQSRWGGKMFHLHVPATEISIKLLWLQSRECAAHNSNNISCSNVNKAIRLELITSASTYYKNYRGSPPHFSLNLHNGMKYVFEIATEPTLHAAILIIIVILSSFAFTIIAIRSGDPRVGIFCATVLNLILWLVLDCLPLFFQKHPHPPPNLKLINHHFNNGQQ